jgi:diguanylate cyclase (GGDEF)-like protein
MSKDAKKQIDRELRQRVLFETYRPIVHGGALAVSIYMIFNSLKRVFFSNALEFQILLPTSIVLAAIAIGALAYVGNARKSSQLELGSIILTSVLLANVLVHLTVSFEQENLVYLVLMMPVMACVATRPRTIALGAAVCFFTLMYFVWTMMPALLLDYASVAVSGLASALGIAMILRRAVINAVSAHLDADGDRERAIHLAQHDALTGLPNRRNFLVHLTRHTEMLSETSCPFLLALVDLDGFKPVNDTHGHAAGDAVLIEVGKRLQDALPPDAVVARLGGDEFAIICPLDTETPPSQFMAVAMCQALRAPFNLGHAEVSLSGSVGIVICKDGDKSESELLECADQAMYAAKRSTPGDAIFYDALPEQDTKPQTHKTEQRSNRRATGTFG